MKYLFRSIGYAIGAILFALGMLKPVISQAGETGQIEIPELSSTPDLPKPFGYKSTWLAVRSENTKAVFDAIGLSHETTANWEAGVQFSYHRDFEESIIPVFVAPPVNGWTLVLTQLGLTSDSEENISELEKLLSQLSEQFGECQYFGSYRVVDYVAWYRATDGEITRGFSFADGILFANIGRMTSAELDAGLFDLTGMTEDALWDAMLKAEESGRIESLFHEETPMKVAGSWSVNPLSFEMSENVDVGTGLVGILTK